jgi:hypothetical protein
MRHIIPISGKDSLCTALVQIKLEPQLDYEFVFNPTGAELPCVFEWLDKVEAYLGKPIARVGEDLLEIIEENNYFLPSRQSRYCTRQSKIEPFEKWIGKDDCIVYYGIRADEVRGGYINAKFPNIVPKYTLKEQGIGISGVYSIINEAGLKPPSFFWESVYSEVCRIIGGEHIVMSYFNEWQIDMMFSWRTRANCYFCFNQRKYEWVGLLEHYPDLFWNAEKLEHSESEYFWNGKDYPLTKIVQLAKSIKRKRIRAIVKILREMQQTTIQFDDANKEHLINDIFSTTSCGLFCGK